MMKLALTGALLSAACSLACAGDVLLSGQVQRVVLQPSGTGDCPPPCGVPDSSQRVCVTNMGGCEAMEVKVDRVYRGQAGPTHRFARRIGEWGPGFPVTDKQIVVHEEGGNVGWSLATVRDGKTYIDPKRLRTIGGVATATAATAEGELVALDEVLARAGAAR